jgi:hypothetical protein
MKSSISQPESPPVGIYLLNVQGALEVLILL